LSTWPTDRGPPTSSGKLGDADLGIRAASWPITGMVDKTVATVIRPGSSAIHIFAIAIKH
jgi:hypothetical protein